MHEKNLHIIPDPEKGFPRPEIPADEAWNNMAELLDKAMPVSPSEPPQTPQKPSTPSGRGLFGSSQFWTIIGGVIIVAGALTWGVIHLVNRPAAENRTNEITTEVNQVLPSDTLTSSIRENAGTTGLNEITESLTEKDQIDRKAEENYAIEKKTEQEKAIQGIQQEQTIKRETTAAPAENKPYVQKTIIEDIVKDSVRIVAPQPEPSAMAADTVKSPVNPSTSENPAARPLTDEKVKNEEKQPEPDTKRSPAGSQNLGWQIGITGNLGEVVQNGRNPNLFYGVMATGGLWFEKVRGGIETGVGYEVYEDYGSVTENIRIDSIPADTLGNIIYQDTSRVTAYKYQYQYVQVPLFISKQLLSRGKFSLDLKTGPLAGFIVADRKTLDNTTGPAGGLLLSTESNDYPRLKISWQWMIIPQFRWNFTDRLSLSLSPYCIFYLNNLYDKDNRPPNMPFGVGISAGLIYRFR